MQRTIFFLFFSLFSIGLFSQTELSEINDPDGFTNIRLGKSSKTAVVTKVELGDLFYSAPSKDSWWKVVTMQGEEGYMHKSRISLITKTTPEYRKELIMSTLDIRKTDQNAVQKAVDAKDLELAKKRRNNLEINVTNLFNPVLPVMRNYICEYKDEKMLDRFIEILLMTQNSANEMPSYRLGEIYICHSKMLTKRIRKEDKKGQEALIGLLDWGFQNVTYDKEKSIKNYDELKAGIEELKRN